MGSPAISSQTLTMVPRDAARGRRATDRAAVRVVAADSDRGVKKCPSPRQQPSVWAATQQRLSGVPLASPEGLETKATQPSPSPRPHKRTPHRTASPDRRRGGRALRSNVGPMKRWATEGSFDSDADMAYIRVVEREEGASKKQVVLKDDELPCVVVVDLDADGRIRGFELFDAAASLPLRLLDRL